MLRVEAADGAGGPWATAVRDDRPVDDQGWALQVTHLGEHAGGHRYAGRWWDPDLHATRWYRFVIEANAGRPVLASDPFH
jgi:hypothetical protein